MKGFVFGKFLPFHKGHQAMVEFAASLCDHLTVLVCCSDKEEIPPETRLQWILETFHDRPDIHPLLLCYNESELPNSSVSSREVSLAWARKFAEILPDVGLLVSSEPYGEYVAEFMGISHVTFDRSRSQVPVSATLIRSDPWVNWQFLPDAVKPFFQRKIAILGTESTGKTVLAERLADRFHAVWIPEAGREIIPDSNKFTQKDLYAVALEHTRRVSEAMLSVPPLLVLDTDLHITQSYAQFSFGAYLPFPAEWYETQRADLYLYAEADAPYVQDGTRMPAEERGMLDLCHKQTMMDFGIRVEPIKGDWNERFLQACLLVEGLRRWG